MNTSTKVYAKNVTAMDMSIDGWSRDFEISQTLAEMTAMGVDITREQIELHWQRLSESYEYKLCSCCGEVTLSPEELRESEVCDTCFNEQVITK